MPFKYNNGNNSSIDALLRKCFGTIPDAKLILFVVLLSRSLVLGTLTAIEPIPVVILRSGK